MSIFDSSPLVPLTQENPVIQSPEPVVFGQPGPETDWLRSFLSAQDKVNNSPVEPTVEETAAVMAMVAPYVSPDYVMVGADGQSVRGAREVAPKPPLMAYCPECGELADFSDALMPEWAEYQCPECFMDFHVSELCAYFCPRCEKPKNSEQVALMEGGMSCLRCGSNVLEAGKVQLPNG